MVGSSQKKVASQLVDKHNCGNATISILKGNRNRSKRKSKRKKARMREEKQLSR